MGPQAPALKMAEVQETSSFRPLGVEQKPMMQKTIQSPPREYQPAADIPQISRVEPAKPSEKVRDEPKKAPAARVHDEPQKTPVARVMDEQKKSPVTTKVADPSP